MSVGMGVLGRLGGRGRREGGFTLIELLVVVVILGVLAAVVVFAVRGVSDRGETSAERTDAQTLRTAEEAFFAQHGRYGTEEELVAGGFLRRASSIHDIALTADGRYVIGFAQPNGGKGGERREVLTLMAGSGNGFPTPFAYQRGPGHTNVHMLFDSLVWRDATGNHIPWLARSWTVAPDGRTWTFTLRDNVRWHDGVALTAHDVVFTVDYIKQHAGPGAAGLAFVSQVVAESDLVVRFELTQPFAPFLRTVIESRSILPRHIWQGVATPRTFHQTSPALAYVGSGPYKLQDPAGYDPSTGQSEYVANDDYFLGAPYVKRLRYVSVANGLEGLRTGVLDASGIPAADGQIEEFVPESVFAPFTDYGRLQAAGEFHRVLLFNMRDDGPGDAFPYNNAKFRQAMALAIDRADLVTRILGGRGEVGSTGGLAPASPFVAPGLPSYPRDLARAGQLLDEIGMTVNPATGFRTLPGGAPFQPTLYDNTRYRIDTPILIMGYLAELNIDVGPENNRRIVAEAVQAADNRARDGNYRMALTGHAGLAGDPDQLRTRFLNTVPGPTTGGFSSVYGWQNSSPAAIEFEALATQQLREADPAARRDQVHQMQRLVAGEVPWLSLYLRESLWLWPPTNDAFSAWYYTPGGTPTGPPGVNNKHVFITGRQFGGLPD